MNKSVTGLLPLTVLFLFISLVILFFHNQLKNAGFNTAVLTGANFLFFLLSVISFFIQLRGITNPNPYVFVRGVMSGMMIKMLVCLIAVFAYVYYSDNYNKRSVFVALFLYVVYLSVEVFVVMKMNKKKNA